MRITAFNGSPRGNKSNTHIIVEAFFQGASDAGAQTEEIFLLQKEIKHCLGCFKCWTRTPGVCVQKDDMAGLLEKIISSDIIILATPVYIDNVSGLMKNFMDRMIPLIDPHFEKDEGGECRHLGRYGKYPKMVVIANCGFPEQSHFQVMRLLFGRIARNMSTEITAEIYRSAGELLSSPHPLLPPIIDNYKTLLRKAGKEVVQNGRLSEETRTQLEKPLIPEELYINGTNKSFDKAIAKHAAAQVK